MNRVMVMDTFRKALFCLAIAGSFVSEGAEQAFIDLSSEVLVALEAKHEQGLHLSHVLTLRESAVCLSDVPEQEIEEAWDWHPSGRVESPYVSTTGVRKTRSGYTASGNAWHSGHGNYPKGDNDLVVIGGDMPRGETSLSASSESQPREDGERSYLYSTFSRASQEGRRGNTSSPQYREHSFGIGDCLFGLVFGPFLILIIFVVIVLPLSLAISDKGPQYLFDGGFRFGLLSLSRYALHHDWHLHIDSAFQEAVWEGKTEWVNLLLASEWEDKSSSKIAFFLVEGLMEHPCLSSAVFRQIARYLSQQDDVDLNDRLTISDRLRYFASADAECPASACSSCASQLGLERKAERVHAKWGDEYRITWSTQPLMMIVCAIPRSDLAELLLQDGLCSNIALLYQSAVEHGETEKAARLLQYGGSGKVALSDAVRVGVRLPVLLNLFRRYLHQGGRVYDDLSYNGGGSLLLQALVWERHDVVGYLLEEYPGLAHYHFGSQESVLRVAATKRSPYLYRFADLPSDWLQKLHVIDHETNQKVWDKLKGLIAATYFNASDYINKEDENGNTPLGRMVRTWFSSTERLHKKQYPEYEKDEMYERIHTMLCLGSDVNVGFREPSSGQFHTLVYYAAIMGNAHLVKLLISHGAKVQEAYLNKSLIRAVGIKPLLNKRYKNEERRS